MQSDGSPSNIMKSTCKACNCIASVSPSSLECWHWIIFQIDEIVIFIDFVNRPSVWFHWDFHFIFYSLYTQGYKRFMTFHHKLYTRQSGDIFLCIFRNTEPSEKKLVYNISLFLPFFCWVDTINVSKHVPASRDSRQLVISVEPHWDAFTQEGHIHNRFVRMKT